MTKKILLISLFLSYLGISYAGTPDPDKVFIKRITYAGSGCAAGTVAKALAPDAKSFSLIFDEYIVETGPNIPSGQNHKKCKITVDLKYPQGWSYTLFKFDYRGYAFLEAGAWGTQKSKYYFQSNPDDYTVFSSTFEGPYDSDFTFYDEIELDEEVWAPCGKQRALHVDTDLSVTGNQYGSITIDTIDGKLTHIYGIKWEQCN